MANALTLQRTVSWTNRMTRLFYDVDDSVDMRGIGMPRSSKQHLSDAQPDYDRNKISGMECPSQRSRKIRPKAPTLMKYYLHNSQHECITQQRLESVNSSSRDIMRGYERRYHTDRLERTGRGLGPCLVVDFNHFLGFFTTLAVWRLSGDYGQCPTIQTRQTMCLSDTIM